ncbi:MAG: GH92 family glycosyl hydrolase [Imperialibacter sp.]|uniref:GH92 family glycosyl hydrolase n=1 Tax=Imperialibacter sp. TaxID=2038411 RepID=UPI0032ED9DA4
MLKLAFRISLVALLFTCASPAFSQTTKEPIDYVNPFVDTHKSRWFFFSSASRPFGMVNLSPDTWVKGSWNSGYLYDSLYVRCFSHIHAWQMSGIPVMPTVGEFKGHLGMEAYKSAFSHDDEQASPGYHRVFLKDYGIKAELTSTTRVGFHKYTYPENVNKDIIFDVGAFLGHGAMDSAKVVKISDKEIEGYSIMAPTHRRPKPTYVYFVAHFDQPMTSFGAWEKGVLKTGIVNEVYGKEVGAFVRFDRKLNKTVQMKVAISYTSTAQARLNMDTELPHWNFEQVVSASKSEWNGYLSKIKVDGGTEKQKVKFYTDLWHSLLGRRIVSDVDGKYCDMTGPKPIVRQVALDNSSKPKHNQYNFDAWWGSHWTLNVLWSMAYPEIMNEFCASMVEMYRNGGLIPRGPSGGNYTYVMIGDPAVSFFATAYNKGIRNYDAVKAYEGLHKNAFPGGIRDRAGYEHRDNPQGGGMNYYVERGYVPEGIPGPGGHKDGAAMTMEYAYQDWCLAQLALPLGKSKDYDFFAKRSLNYKNLWNPETHYIHPKNIDGTWIENFTPIGDGFNTLGFVESNSAIYTNYVPHDLKGLAALFGGADKYVQYVDSCFIKAKPTKFITDHGKHAQNWVDYENQPSCQMAHLFNHAGAPWLSQKWVREVKEITFSDITPYGGYNGDEDQGQMGALGVLMAIGLFQMDGGASVNSSYDITTPIFDKVEIQLDPKYYSGKTFTISTENNSADNIYIQKASLNGKDWTKFSFPHEVFSQGGELKLTLGKSPNKAWGLEQ